MAVNTYISPFRAIIIFIIFSVLGIFIIPKLSVRLNPGNKLSSITVSYTLPGASPYILEKSVTAVLEANFSAIQGVSKIESNSSKDNGTITISFDSYTDIDMARFEVATQIRQLYKKLPKQLTYPSISLNRPEEDGSERELVSYSINALLPPSEIQEVVKTLIEPEIGQIQDVYRIKLHGATTKEYLIRYNEKLLKEYKIGKQDIVKVLKQHFSKSSLGEILYYDQYISVSVNSEKALNWHLPIKKIASRIIYLDQLVTINKIDQEPRSYYRINAKNAVTFSIYPVKNANSIVLSDIIENKINELKKQLPNGFNIIKTYDSTEYLKKELHKIYLRSFYTVLILLLFILLVSRSYRYLLITVIGLISNLSIAFLLYYSFGIEIQLYSLAGITISLGLILDNTIVMIDHLKKQKNLNVFLPILASTLTTVGALTIIYFLDESLRLNLIDFAWVIIINLIVSLIVSLFLIPGLFQILPVKERNQRDFLTKLETTFYKTYQWVLKKLLRFKKLAIVLIIWLFGIPFFLLPQQMDSEKPFSKIYNATIGNEWFTDQIRPYVDKYLGGSFRLFSFYVFENAYYSRNEDTRLYVTASMEKGATIHQLNEAFLPLENYLLSFSEIKQFVTHVYSNNYASLEILFNDQHVHTSFPYILKALLIRKSIDLGGIKWGIYGVGQGFNSGGGYNEPINFNVKATGYNYDVLNKWCDTLKTALLKHPRISEVIIKGGKRMWTKPSYKYVFRLDKKRMVLKNISTKDIFNELKQVTLSKQKEASFLVDEEYIPIRLESKHVQDFDFWHVKNIPLDSLDKPIVLKNIIDVSKQRAEASIYKENQEYLRLIQFQYTGSYKFGKKYLDEKLSDLKKQLPLGYKFEIGNMGWLLREKAKNNYLLLLFLVLAIIYLICAVLFESVRQPFIILSIVPISYIGVFLTFYLFDFNFDQGGLASFILLTGITVNSSIYLVNEYNTIKNKALVSDSLECYIKAFKQKIFPIFLTITSTILGFIPFVIDGQNEVFWFALGAGTIGGLIFSFFGILFYLPLFVLRK